MKNTEASPSPDDVKKAQPEEFDIVILGGGTGATLAAWTFASEGKRVANHRPQIYRRLVSEHRLPAEQEHHSQREGRLLRAAQRRVRHRSRRLQDWICPACVIVSARWYPA